MKDDSFKGRDDKVSPLQLYQATPTQRFMKRCDEVGVDWAIFSDKYGFVFRQSQIQWYEKHPDTVTCSEKRKLLEDAFDVLKQYDIAYFYYNPGRIHPLYEELVEEMRSCGREVLKITHLSQISKE